MKKLVAPVLVCAAAALFVPATAYACPDGCGPSSTGASRLDVAEHPSTQTDTTLAQKQADHAKSFLNASAELTQEDRDCFLDRVLQGQYYDQDSHTIATDTSARTSHSTELEQFTSTGRFQASEFSAWLYQHEDTWRAGDSPHYQVGDVLSLSGQGASWGLSSTEFFATVKTVALYIGDGKVIYCPGQGTGAQIREQSITALQTEQNLSITLISRPCNKNTTPTPSPTPSQSSTSTPSTSTPSQSATDSVAPSPSSATSSRAPEEQSPSMAAPSQGSDTAAPSESTSAAPSSSSSSASSARPGSLPKTGGGAALSAVGAATLLAGAGGSILARRRRNRG